MIVRRVAPLTWCVVESPILGIGQPNWRYYHCLLQTRPIFRESNSWPRIVPSADLPGLYHQYLSEPTYGGKSLWLIPISVDGLTLLNSWPSCKPLGANKLLWTIKVSTPSPTIPFLGSSSSRTAMWCLYFYDVTKRSTACGIRTRWPTL